MPEIVQPQSQIVTQLIQNKLSAINQLVRQNQFTTRNDGTQGDLLSAVQLAINQYLSALQSSDSTANTNLVNRGNINSSTNYNNFWTGVNNDLSVLYAEANNVGQILVDNYNYVNADIQNILIQLKQADSSIQNYELLTNSPIGNQQTFIENFTSTSQIDVNSALLGDTQCNIDTIEGIVTLGITSSTTVQPSDVSNIVIGSANSNGTIYGSTQLLDIIDNTDFGLFQYQLTSSTYQQQQITLDFTIVLNQLTPINFIRIVPNNFGTTTWPTITAIDVSSDGVNFTSIRDILLGVDNDPTQFTLAPQTSNFAGEGRYSFLPEQVMYVHFTITQTTPYVNPNTGLYTWAIGLKDIELIGNQFAATSQVLSLPYTFSAGVSKIAITGDELPQLAYTNGNVSSLGSVFHDISLDGGMTWTQVAPEYISTPPSTLPTILNVNNVDSQLNPTVPGSINTIQVATSVRYRLRLASNASVLNNPTLLPYFSPVVRNITLQVDTQEVI